MHLSTKDAEAITEDEAWEQALAKEEPMEEILDEDLFKKPHEEECPICLCPLDFEELEPQHDQLL